jgi:hypothetical protein
MGMEEHIKSIEGNKGQASSTMGWSYLSNLANWVHRLEGKILDLKSVPSKFDRW